MSKPSGRKRSLRPYLRRATPTGHRPINLPQAYWTRIDAEADRAGTSRSGYVRGMIEYVWASAEEFVSPAAAGAAADE